MHCKFLLRAAAAAIVIQFSCAQGQEEKPVYLQFLAFPQQERPKPIQLLIGEDKTIPIETPGNELSPAYKVKGLSTIVVGIMAMNEKKEPVFQVLGKAAALTSSKQIVLLMRRGDKDEDGFAVIPVDGDLGKFAGGNYFFINASKLAVGGKIGDKSFALKPGQKGLIEPAASHAGGGCQVTLSYQREEKWKTFYDTRWSVNKRFRTLVFFYQDPESGSLGVAPIVEML